MSARAPSSPFGEPNLSELERALGEACRAFGTLSPSDRREAQRIMLELAAQPELREQARALLGPLVEHAEHYVRTKALMALGAAVGEEALPLIAREAEGAPAAEDPGLRCDLAAAASRAGPAAQPLLERFLRDSFQEVRFEAALALARQGSGAGRFELEEALREPRIRLEALWALRELRDTRSVEPLLRLYNKWMLPAFDRTAAACALARCGSKVGLDHLLSRLAAKKGDDRGMAIAEAVELGLNEAIEPLEALIERRDLLFTGAAARALAMLAPDQCGPLLSQIALGSEHDDETRLDVIEGLAESQAPQARLVLEQIAIQLAPEEPLALRAKRLLGDEGSALG